MNRLNLASRRWPFVAVALAAMTAMSASAQLEWTELPNMPGFRFESGAVVLDDKLFVFAGAHLEGRTGGRVDVYDPKTNAWRRLSDMPGHISHMNTALAGRTVWYPGGQKNSEAVPLDEVWRYDVDTDTYTAGPDLPEPRSAGTLARVGGAHFFIGGGKRTK